MSGVCIVELPDEEARNYNIEFEHAGFEVDCIDMSVSFKCSVQHLLK